MSDDTIAAGRRQAVLVVNTRSRRGQRLYEDAKSGLRQAGFEVTAFPIGDPARIPEAVDEAVAKGSRLVVVGGGDGTIRAVAGSLAGRDAALGLLPMGTANNFARGNGIPIDLAGAIAAVARGRVAAVDLGRVNGGYFTNAVSFGLAGSLHRSGPVRMKKYFGRAGYLAAALRSLATHRSFHVRIHHEGGVLEREALDLRVANGPFYGGVRAIPEADPQNGRLVLRLVTGRSKWALGRAWAGVFVGGARPPSVETLVIDAARIEAEPVQYVSVDGEVVMQTPLDVEVVRGALKLLVP